MLGDRAVDQRRRQVVEPHLAVGLDVEQLLHRVTSAPLGVRRSLGMR
jgi:hypothetical protein